MGLASKLQWVRSLGKGGFGDVWLAQHRDDGKHYVVKILREAHDPECRRRFMREAKLLQKYRDHPCIVRFIEYCDGKHPWIIMEAMEASLGDRLTGPLDPKIAASIVRVVATALAAIHKNGDVHRDVKPDNILLRSDGTYKLADFGLGRGGPTAMLTFGWLGTPGYMAPEVAGGGQATTAADVYSLGATLFHLLTGRRPEQGEALDPARYGHQVPAELLLLLRAMTASEPRRRPTAQDVVARLTVYAGGKEPTRTSTPWWEDLLAGVAIGVGVVAAIGLGVAVARRLRA